MSTNKHTAQPGRYTVQVTVQVWADDRQDAYRQIQQALSRKRDGVEFVDAEDTLIEPLCAHLSGAEYDPDHWSYGDWRDLAVTGTRYCADCLAAIAALPRLTKAQQREVHARGYRVPPQSHDVCSGDGLIVPGDVATVRYSTGRWTAGQQVQVQSYANAGFNGIIAYVTVLATGERSSLQAGNLDPVHATPPAVSGRWIPVCELCGEPAGEGGALCPACAATK
ncbi:MAG TPA: hypothetical protein VKE96_12520 [Vicinamibacterales bacterium]|nr:hypothetical protein [Vicinamibacterales bacterium]